MSILKKLTLKNLKMNKVRTVVTILGIVLSIALITVVVGIFFSGWQSVIQATIQFGGDYDFMLSGDFDKSSIQYVSDNRNVKDVYAVEFITSAKNNSPKYTFKPYINIFNTDEKTLIANNCKLESGRFPQKDDELLLSESVISGSETVYRVGDTITLETGKRYFNQDKAVIEGQIDPNAALSFNQIYLFDAEVFRTEEKKTYTIVGILSNEGGFLSNMFEGYSNIPPAFTYAPVTNVQQLFVRLHDNVEGDYYRVAAELTGIDQDLIEKFMNYNITEDEIMDAIGMTDKHLSGLDGFVLNTSLLTIKGLYSNNNEIAVLIGILAFVLGIVFLASVFIIRNSFAISITEKTKLYGMLASTGATPKQIYRNVFFEAALLGLVGVPLGLLLGSGATAVLLSICNSLLGDLLDGMTLIFYIPFFAVLLALVLGFATVFVSAATPAVRAAKISPMEAIRSTKDIKVGKKGKDKTYRTPKLVRKLFGIGGSIAWKNMKRSRKQYRTTVVSIIISVAVYITAASFVDYNIAYLQSQSFYKNAAYNMDVELRTDKYNSDTDSYETLSTKEINGRITDVMSQIKGINKFRYVINNSYYDFDIPLSSLGDEAREKFLEQDTANPDNTLTVGYTFFAVDEDSFRSLCKQNGKTYEEYKNKGFVHNVTEVYVRDEEGRSSHKKQVPVLKDPVGMTLKGVYTRYDYEEDGDNTDGYGDPIYKEILVGEYHADIEIGGVIDDDFKLGFNDMPDSYIVVSEEWQRANLCDNGYPNGYIGLRLLLDVENPDEAEETLLYLSITTEDPVVYFTNYARLVNNIRSLILVVQIFVYGFILVISLIGLTNIFNTITNNMKLRQKEFAMLRSVGTTKNEFNRMIRLESLLYTFKSLLIGLPIGIAAGYVICLLYGNTASNLGYIFPWTAVLISILAVLILLWVIMRFSVRKVNKMNIIETIRNDNV